MQISVITSAGTLSAATSAQLIPARSGRMRLTIQNTGTGSMTFAFSSPVVAGAGITLDPASAAAGQGGSYEFGVDVPTDAIFAISSAGTTWAVLEGVGHP